MVASGVGWSWLRRAPKLPGKHQNVGKNASERGSAAAGHRGIRPPCLGDPCGAGDARGTLPGAGGSSSWGPPRTTLSQRCWGIPAASPLPTRRAGRFGQHPPRWVPAMGWVPSRAGDGGSSGAGSAVASGRGARGGLPAPGTRAGETGRRRMADPGGIFISRLEDSSLAFSFFFSFLFFPSLQIKKTPRRSGKGGGCEQNPLCAEEPSRQRWLRRRPRCSPRAAPASARRSLLRLGLFQGIVQLLQRLFNPQGGEAGRGALVPALLHDLRQRRQNLGEAQKEGGKMERVRGEQRSGSGWERGGPPGLTESEKRRLGTTGVC